MVHGASVRLCLEKSLKIKAYKLRVLLLFEELLGFNCWFIMNAVLFEAQADACAMNSFYTQWDQKAKPLRFVKGLGKVLYFTILFVVIAR